MTAALEMRHIGIVVSDMNRALHFYRDYLGLEVFWHVPLRSGDYLDALTALPSVKADICLLDLPGGGRVELLHFPSHAGEAPGPAMINHVGRSHLALTVGDVKSLYDKRVEHGVDFQSPPLESPDGVLVCFCRDPDGTLIELVEPRKDIYGS